MCTYICRFVIPMRKISYTVPPTLDGSSVAAVLRCHGFSTALLRSLKKCYGALSRNGCPVRTVDPVHTGDIVAVELNTDGATAPPSAEKAVIVYADRDILVVNKRAGMAMYETYNHHGNALSNAVAAAGFDGPFRPIYRLDKDTSGLVVLARHQLSAAKLAGRVQKDYYAVVPGTYTGSGTVDAPIAHCPDSTVKRQVDPAGAARRPHPAARATGNRPHPPNSGTLCPPGHTLGGRQPIRYGACRHPPPAALQDHTPNAPGAGRAGRL